MYKQSHVTLQPAANSNDRSVGLDSGSVWRIFAGALTKHRLKMFHGGKRIIEVM
jgi:hypothetical protein